jgi:hypothetical protein
VVFRIVSAIMTALFLVAVAVQYNDPDPVPWMAIYGSALVLSAWVVVRGRAPLLPAVVVALVSLVYGLAVGAALPRQVALSEMFQAWEMKSPAIEEAREAVGLLIVAVWTCVLSFHAWWARRR